jgi:hypothetical protein
MNDDRMSGIGDPQLVPSLVGRTITAAEIEYDVNSGGYYVLMDLDDGRTIYVGGWGHSWWGVKLYDYGERMDDCG